MEEDKIKIGITHGDINGIGYEVILKAFADPTMLELCTPVVYGSPKVAAYHRKSLDLPTNFSIIASAAEAAADRLSIVNCVSDEIKVEFAKPDAEAGKAAVSALDKAILECQGNLIDVIVAAPVNLQLVNAGNNSFVGQSEYIKERMDAGSKPLSMLVKDDIRVALLTSHVPFREVAPAITKESVQEKIKVFYRSLKCDFGISTPRIAVLALNPHASAGGMLGTEENDVIIPAMADLRNKGILSFGPYAPDDFLCSGKCARFDGILAMYHDQGLMLFKALAGEDGVKFAAGTSFVCTSPIHGVAYDIAGKGVASEDSFRQAVYLAMDVFRNRRQERALHEHPLRRQYYEKRDDSDKLKLDAVEEGA